MTEFKKPRYYPATFSLIGEKIIISPGKFAYYNIETAQEVARIMHGQYQAVVEANEDGSPSDKIV